jgi:hypothetical protein
MTDFRALCAELHAAFNTYAVDEPHHDLLVRARAALAQPEPQGPGPTDEQLLALRSWSSYSYTFDSDLVDFARAVLARWGNYQVSLTSSTQPLPEQEVSRG